MIPYGTQCVDDHDRSAVDAVLRSDFLTQGPQVPAFEQAVASCVQAPHAVAVSSATAALHLACLALEVGPGDWVWTSPISFVASANCARYCGASVDFVDIDPATLNLCPRALAAKLIDAERLGRLPKVVIPVHFGGQPCDMAAIAALAERYGFAIIEDASHAIGAWHGQHPVGSCQYSAITIFSFHPVKIITTGEGGIATTGDAHLAARLKALRSHGITRERGEFELDDHGPWYYEQQTLGYNYRLTDIQAALGLSQLARLEQFIERRHVLAERYRQKLANLAIDWQLLPADDRSALHLFVIRVAAKRRRAIFEALRDAGIGVNVHYVPVYLQPEYRRLGFTDGHCPQAELYYQQALTLPLHPRLSDDAQEHVVARLRELLA